MKYLLLLMFIAFAGLKSKPDIQPCSKKIERIYYFKGKIVQVSNDEFFNLSFNPSVIINDIPSGRKIKSDSATFKIYEPK